MKATLSCIAVVLFAAFANCVPVTKVDQANTAVSSNSSSDSGSNSSATPTTVNIVTTNSVFSTQIALPNGTVVQETCNATQVTDILTADTVITTLCGPSSDDDSATSSSNSTDGSNAQGLGVAIVSTGTATPEDVTAALGSQNTTSSSSTDNQTSSSSDQGVGAAIIGHGSIPADSVGQSTAGAQTPAVKRRTTEVGMTSTVPTPEGSVVENCRIQLTPDANGQFTEEQSCKLSLEPNISDMNGGDNGAAPSNPIEPSSSAAAVTPSNTPGVVSSSSSSASVPQAATPSPTPSAPSPPAPSVSPATSVPVPLSPSPVADSSPVSAGAIIMGTSVTSMDLPSVSPTASVISAAEDNTTSAFTMPGRSISILPVGLAVFAGVSVIALIVVGVVTYERTKYRKNFRDRKLAEQMKAKTDMFSERSMA